MAGKKPKTLKDLVEQWKATAFSAAPPDELSNVVKDRVRRTISSNRAAGGEEKQVPETIVASTIDILTRELGSKPPDPVCSLIEKVVQEIVGKSGPGEITRLLLSWRDGTIDPQKEDELFRLLESFLRPVIARKLFATGNLHSILIKDIFADVYTALRKADIPRPWINRYQFRVMVRKIIDNMLTDNFRAAGAKKRPQSELKVTIEGWNEPVDPGADYFNYFVCKEALIKLGEINAREKQVVELRFFEDLDVEQVAEMLDISAATVKRISAHALQNLKMILSELPKPLSGVPTFESQ